MVPVPGAHLYYELRGTGPLLLIVQGGAADADATPGFIEQLARHYTVATYDRRGYSRSTLEGAPQKLQITTHGDDAHLLLAALGTSVRGGLPARAFGSSIGALIALDLTARYPEQVRTLVAHEAPLVQLAAADGAFRGLGGAGASGADPQAALQQFAGDLGIDPNDHEPGVTPAPPSPYAAQNAKYFVDYDVQAAATYRPDLAAITKVGSRIVSAAGSTSRDTQPYRAAAALAERLGSQLVEFPGSHAGYAQRPRAFAALLRDVFGD
jgi:pimeloyl-ACP methyl ester carboxylesterase